MSSRVWIFGANVDTDSILPGQYLNLSNPEELAKHCMEGLDKEFSSKIKAGDIIVAGDNFGCGSSREHAPIALKAANIAYVIAKSFSRIFFRNSINIGFPVITCEEAVIDIEEKDLIEIDNEIGSIINITKNITYQYDPFPPFIQNMISCGGLIPYTSKRILEKTIQD